MSMKKFKDKKKRLRRRRRRHRRHRRHRRRRQINHKISVPKIFLYNKLKEKLNWTPVGKTSFFPPRGIKNTIHLIQVSKRYIKCLLS